jgi:hypothetical protein
MPDVVLRINATGLRWCDLNDIEQYIWWSIHCVQYLGDKETRPGPQNSCAHQIYAERIGLLR